MTHTPVAERDTAFQHNGSADVRPESDSTETRSLYGMRPPVPQPDDSPIVDETPWWKRILRFILTVLSYVLVVAVILGFVALIWWGIDNAEARAYNNGYADGYHQGQNDGYQEGYNAGAQSNIAGGADTTSEETVVAASMQFTFCEAQIDPYDPTRVMLVTDSDDLLVPYNLYAASQVVPLMQASVEFDDAGMATKLVPLPNVEPNFVGCRSASTVPTGPVPVG